jgi:hypothetical protein
MNKRQKKKLENRAGFFHYRDYKLRVIILYDIFESVINYNAPYTFKQYMFNCTKNVLFTKAPTKIFKMPELENCVGSSFGRFNAIASVNESIKDTDSIKHMSSAVFDLRKTNRGEATLENECTTEEEAQET